MSGLGVVQQDKNATFDKKMARSLEAILRAKHLISANSAPLTWPREFKELRQFYDESHISQVLDWYATNLSKKYTPQVQSASGFRKKFSAIVEAMKRSSGEVASNMEPGVETTDQARKLKKEMALNWPGEEGSKELAFIQLNLNFCSNFSRRLKQVYQRMKEDCDRKQQRSLLLEGYAKTSTRRMLLKVIHLYHCHSSPMDMTKWWCEHVNNVAWNWAGWQGNLLAWVLTDSNPKFNQAMARIIADEFGDGRSWGYIRQILSKEK